MVRVFNETQGKPLGDRVREATGFVERFRGLMGVRALEVGEGLHLVPCNSIHTFFMRIAIDALFLDRAGRVVKVYGALPPWRLSSIHFDVASVLELPAGVAAASGTVAGDVLRFEASKEL